MTAPPTIIVVAPIEPSSTGNGLAMRVEMLVESAGLDHGVELVIIPVVGRPPVVRTDIEIARRHDIAPHRKAGHHSLMGWLSSEVWRQRLEAVAPLPDLVARVPLAEADDLAEELAQSAPCAVLACRLTTAAFALRLAERLGVPLVIDADDDDEALFRSLGDDTGAHAWRRVAEMALPRAATCFAASQEVADALAARHALAPPAIAVHNPAPQPSMPLGPRPGLNRLLMVANFTYQPNIDGAQWFIDQVMPHLVGSWSCDLVGAGSSQLIAAESLRVRAHEDVDDVSPHYDQCDVVVVPLLTGSGTRVKVLEGFTHRRPVVATPTAVEGLGVVDGVHAMVRNDPVAFAHAIERSADDHQTSPLVEAAVELISEAYDRGTITHELARHIQRVATVATSISAREEPR